MLHGRRILLVIGGGIAAYKSLDLIRRLQDRGADVVPVMTRAAEEFVTPLSVSALAGQKAYRDLFDLTDEAEMGHIQLSRAADLIVVAPATANLMAKMAQGIADNLATTLLMATDKRVLIAPAMNVQMWQHAATQRNLQVLQDDGVLAIGPNEGDMACGEYGPGRMAEVSEIVAAVENVLLNGPLKGKHVIVTSGPTHEPIDPVRYIANRSSGTQGSAIANALAGMGARVTFVTGPVSSELPGGCEIVQVETATEMKAAVDAALPVDAAIFAAAVADWRVTSQSGSKIKKDGSGKLPVLEFTENPDILATVSQLKTGRPQLVVGFAAETDDVMANATAKRARKGCDWIVANDVSPETGIMGGAENAVTLISEDAADVWPRMSKDEVAHKLAARIAGRSRMADLKVKITRLAGSDDAIALPAYETSGAAGMDLRANLPDAVREHGLTLEPGRRTLVPTGLALEIPPGFEAQIRPRSGLALKCGVTLANTPGTIDSDYRGPLGVILINLGNGEFKVGHGDRIAQIVFAPVVQASWAESETLSGSERGSGGFGSTGQG
ncbi:MAG: bifunctional phosphopantothenoylcysteine decarboxylase/phosphopantothenate--cysteine ligase CoaBC [Rhodobacteraceae bacterium]|nr:bifunctional phosphopantothenoylcysteine decarboxylase/phosphopantothenate--cysteine ligase CoaBC [Paracoccaceae bacterium]